MRNKRILITIDELTYKRLSKLAKKLNLNKSATIRELINSTYTTKVAKKSQ